MNIIKKLAMSLAALVTIIAPVAAQSFPDVRIESQVNVANVNKNESYRKTTSATDGEVVKIQVWYHNKEDANSGKIANNLKVKIGLPTTPGKVQTITSTVSADNSNTVNDTATVNLTLDNAYLEYIPGSAEWRHNKGTDAAVNYVTEKISDTVVTSGTGLVLENAQPCFNFEATVSILARVRASAVSVVKQVRVVGEKDWKVENTAKAGDTLEYQITFKNEGNTTLKNVVVADNLPAFMTYVNGSTMLKSTAFPNGITVNSDRLTTGGIDVGNYAPGSVGYVKFQAKINTDLKCDTYIFKNVALVKPENVATVVNTAITRVNVVCVQTPPPPVTPPVTPPAPVTPAPLPETGAASAAAGVLGSGALGYAVHYYRRSKQSLINALKR